MWINGLNIIWKTLAGPTDILEEWAKEPLKRWENNREQQKKEADFKRDQQSKENDLKRKIEAKTAERRFESDIKQKEETHHAELEIRMQTEINKINVETEQWRKDQDFVRWKNITESIGYYKERLTLLQINAIRAIATMDLELKEKAQDLILRKIIQYKQLQDQAEKDTEAELERVMTKFPNNDKALEIMLSMITKKADNIIRNAGDFMNQLKDDITQLCDSVDLLTKNSQKFIDNQLSQVPQVEKFDDSTKQLE